MSRIIVVGSGASGVHFALTALRKGYRVLLLDVGHPKPEPLRPDLDYVALKSELPDPAAYFLGNDYEALILPQSTAEYYAFPPSKNYVFTRSFDSRYRARGFAPLMSFAEGGLAEAWTGGSYPFTAEEMSDFPVNYREMLDGYEEVANRIGITGAADDLSRFFPPHAGLLEPLDLDEHSRVLLEAYQRKRDALNRTLRCFAGRSRIAVLSRDHGHRKACRYSARCLWGCPSESFYTPSLTLQECREYPDFEYMRNVRVLSFRFTDGGKITRLLAASTTGSVVHELEVDKLVLAAGALGTSEIFLRSIYENSGTILKLPGLMDNRQVLMPFVNVRMIGKPYDPRSYQYHQIALGIEGNTAADYIHCLITTLKTAMIHPVVQSLPFDLATSLAIFRGLHAALGLVNVNFSDRRRPENFLTLEADGAADAPRLVIHYQPAKGEEQRIARGTDTVRTALRKLGCFAPRSMVHIRPMGASVHYAGTIPMASHPAALNCSPYCQSHDFQNLYLADGTTFPSLPSKNLTLTLMANAVRIAKQAF